VKRSNILPAFFAVVILTLPVASMAQSQPDWQNHQGQSQQGQRDRDDRNRDSRDRDARDRRQQNQQSRENDQREHRDDRNNRGGYNTGGYNNGNYGRGGYNNGGNGNYGGQINGIVSSFSAFNLQLNNGQHVDLHQGTVINPTGTTLQPGMRISIVGHDEGNGSFAAATINVVGNNGNYGNTGNAGNYGNYGGILQSILGGLGH